MMLPMPYGEKLRMAAKRQAPEALVKECKVITNATWVK